MFLEGELITKDNIPEAFGTYFKNKVDHLANTCKVENDVYNGQKIINAQEEFFMTEPNILKILKSLKIKKL